MSAQTAVALVVALAATTLTNVAYLREHDAAAALPALSLRRPMHSAYVLLSDRSWLLGFLLEGGGFALYVVALALAPLTLVQSIAAGGIGILAFVSARLRRRRLAPHELTGVLVSIVGLVTLAVSLAGGSGEGSGGSVARIVVWLGATAGGAVVVLELGRRLGASALAAAEGIAGGLFFSIGDISVKVATQGGGRAAFAVGVLLGYTLGTALLQLGYQHAGALTVAGLATLLTNALPIAAGTVVLGEPVPSGAYGDLRVVAFAAVTLGAILLARPERAGAPASEIAGTPFRLQRLDHVSLNAGDRTRSIAWYRDVLGLEQRNEPRKDDWPVFMGEFGRCIGLFQAAGPAPERDGETAGLRHIAFTVGRDDLEHAQAHFARLAIEFRVEDHGNAHSVYLRDPDGHTVELTTYELT
jgi:catechol 2,3-dioxygenase-like lactoylglutathione lyase family enzyme